MSMYGKDVDLVRREQQKQSYYPDPPTYTSKKIETTTEKLETDSVLEIEPVECTPGMILHPISLLRMFELAMFFIMQWLVQITCGNDACTMIMNVFGYTALGQVFVLIIFLGLSLLCGIILVVTTLNFHRAFPGLIKGVEKLYAVLGIFFMLIAGILGIWMAVLTKDPEVNYQGRGAGHIRGQWIAAAVLEFLMIGVYVFDFWLQGKPNYPFGIKDYQSGAYPTRLELEAGYGYPPAYHETTKTITTTTQQQRFEPPSPPHQQFEPIPAYQPPRPAYKPPSPISMPQDYYGGGQSAV